ncbi:transcription factor MYB105-like [Olea europaea var. sylvestris]|uniref:transcription factor MYB105-like n=1 Tax=Olea europaea var. sylvestris TaxID=158386 RepID=UPI000C1D31CB|nr:transcription factor MYB105-like [Olea europaea var. sylvestris]
MHPEHGLHAVLKNCVKMLENQAPSLSWLGCVLNMACTPCPRNCLEMLKNEVTFLSRPGCVLNMACTDNYTTREPCFMEGLQHEKQTLGENLSVNVIPASVNPDRKEKRENSFSSGYQIKGQWTGEEDRRLISLVHQFGLRKWVVIAEEMVGRVGKQCRERWNNHLDSRIKKDVLTDNEER